MADSVSPQARDDHYLVGDPEEVLEAAERLKEELGGLGLELQPEKTAIYRERVFEPEFVERARRRRYNVVDSEAGIMVSGVPVGASAFCQASVTIKRRT